MEGLLALILKILSLIGNIQTVQNLIERLSSVKSIKDCHSRSKIIENPGLIMGDRANESDGFSEKDYLKREGLDVTLEENFREKNPKDREHNIVVITGRHASGKSRIVWEFIRSDIGSIFKTIYVPRNSSKTEALDNKPIKNEDLKHEIARIPASTLVVFDDIDNLLDFEYRKLSLESLLEILAGINDKDQACLITLSSSVPKYKEIRKLLESDSALGRRKTKRVLFLDIEDIERGDDTFLWCTANYPLSRYSKVIGGYIPQLTRYANVNVQKIISEPSVVLYLTSFIILKRFRNRFRVYTERISLLNKTIREKDHLEDLPKGPEPERIRILFDTGMLRYCSNGLEIEVDDEYLFDSFSFYCIALGKTGNDSERIIRKYLAESQSSEREQIIRLIEAGHGEDPAVFSRILTRSRYPELRRLTTNWFVKKFFEYTELPDPPYFSPKSLKSEYKSKTAILAEIGFTVSIIVGRAIDPVSCCESFMIAGISPSITLVNELIRASMNHRLPQDKKAIMSYALELKNKYGIEDDLYFCQVMEASEYDYDEDRVIRAQELYRESYDRLTAPSTKDDEQLDNLNNTMDSFCSRLAEKADSKERMDLYFRMLRKYTGLYLGKGALRKLINKIAGKAGSAAAPLLQLLSEELLAASPDIISEDICNTGLLSIMEKCQDAQVCLDLYDYIAPSVESTMHKAFTNEYKNKMKFLNVMAIHLARKMSRLSLDDSDYMRIQTLLKDRVNAACQDNDFGAANKLYNITLNCQPNRPISKALNNLLSLYSDESWLAGKRDINNLNSAFQNALAPFKRDLLKSLLNNEGERTSRCKHIKNIAFCFEQLRKEDDIQADGRYKLFLFSSIDSIKHIDSSFPTNDILEKIEFDCNAERVNETTLNKDELLWCQAIRLSETPQLPVRVSEVCLSLAEKKDYLMDTVNHLITAFCEHFSENNDLRMNLQRLVKLTFDSIPHTIHDYCHYLSFHAQIGSLVNEDEIIGFIDDVWTRLQSMDYPLREENADLLCTAISLNSLNLQQAIDIVRFAIQYDKSYRYRSVPILTLDSITGLAKKFKREEEEINKDPKYWPVNEGVLNDYANQIQQIIYSIDTVGYPNKDFVFNKIKNPIDGPLSAKYGRRVFTRIPFESDITNIRRDSLLKRIDENGRVRCSSYEAECFLFQELFFANSFILHDCRKNDENKSDISDYLDYILLLLESAWVTGKRIDLETINHNRFLNVFYKTNRWQYYNSFFEGYLLGGYVPSDLEDRWRDSAKKYGFVIQG